MAYGMGAASAATKAPKTWQRQNAALRCTRRERNKIMSASPPKNRPITGMLLIGTAFFLALVWGSAFTMTRVAVREISPMWLVALRCTIGSVFLVSWMFYRGRRFPKLTDIRWRWYLLMGFVGMVLPFWLFSTGQQYIDSGLAAILAATMPLFTIILAHFFANEPLSLRKALGFFIGFVGIVTLFLPEEFTLALVADWRSQAIMVMGAFCYASTTIIAKRAPETPASVGAAMMVICASIMAIGLAFSSGLPARAPSGLSWLMGLGLGVGSTGVATIIYLTVVKRNGPSVLAKINYFPPLVSVALGIWLLKEPFSWRLIAAFVIILIGVLIARSDRKDAPKPIGLLER